MSSRIWRLLRLLLVVVLLVVVAFHVAGGWYYSGKIKADALNVDPWEWETPLTVDQASDISITLTEGDVEDDDLRRSGSTYGLIWDGGFGRITGDAQVDGSSVTRDFELMSGSLPAQGTAAGVDSFAFPATIEAPRQTVDYTSPLGTMTAAYLPGTGTTWAVLVHGKGASPDEQYRAMDVASGLGMPSMSINYRNDVAMPADPSGEYAYGATEWEDLAGAVDYAREQGATGVVLFGGSMGGAIVAAYLRNAEDTSLVKGMVLDSPMLDFAQTIGYGAEQLELPAGAQVPPTLTWSALLLASVRYGVDWGGLDYNTDTAWVSVPTLIFHGSGDLTVPIKTSRDLALRDPDVTLIETPGAGHVESWNVDPEAYESTLAEFLKVLLR